MQQGKSLLLQINRIRMNPQGTIFDLKEQISRFDGPNTVLTNNNERLKVAEGKYVWTEAIIFLQNCPSRDPLVWCQPLAYIANEYENQTRNGKEVSPFQLLKQRYEYNGNISFNVSQSQAEQSNREIVLSMIVDDGDKSRGNRTTVTEGKYTHFGGFVTKRGKVTISVMFFSDISDFKLKLSGGISDSVNQITSSSVSPTTQQLLDTGRQLIYELNDIRRDPKRLIPQLKADLSKFKPDGSISKNGCSFATKQGKVAFLDLITELQQMKPVPHILRSDGLSIAATDQVTQLDRQSKFSTVITNKGSNVNKYTTMTENSSNFIANKEDKDLISDILIFALVDDGDVTRSVRRRLLNPSMKFVGAAVGQKFYAINVAEKVEDNKKEINSFLQYANRDGREKPSYTGSGSTGVKFDDRVTFGVEDKYTAPSVSTSIPAYSSPYTGTPSFTNAYTSSYHPPPSITVTPPTNFTNSYSTSNSSSYVNNSKLGSSNPYTYGSTVFDQQPESPRFKGEERERGTGGKIITKKTTKSSTSSRNGRTYKKIVTKVTYEDGTVSETEEEEIVN